MWRKHPPDALGIKLPEVVMCNSQDQKICHMAVQPVRPYRVQPVHRREGCRIHMRIMYDDIETMTPETPGQLRHFGVPLVGHVLLERRAKDERTRAH